MLVQSVKNKCGNWYRIIYILLVCPNHPEIQNSKRLQVAETVLSFLAVLAFLYALYWLLLIGCAVSDQCWNDWAGY